MTETHPLAPLKTVTLGFELDVWFDVTTLDDDVVSSVFTLLLFSMIGFGDTVSSSEFEVFFDGTLDGVSSVLTLVAAPSAIAIKNKISSESEGENITFMLNLILMNKVIWERVQKSKMTATNRESSKKANWRSPKFQAGPPKFTSLICRAAGG